MKQLFYIFILSSFITSCADTGAGCPQTLYNYEPIFKTIEEIRTVTAQSPKEIVSAGKIYLYKDHIFINDYHKGIHVFDNRNPASPNKIAFYNIPGNTNLSIKNDILYADNSIDILSIDISSIQNPEVVDVDEHIYQADGDYHADSILVDFHVSPYILDNACEKVRLYNDYSSLAYNSDGSGGLSTSAELASAPPEVGMGGSLARFTIVGEQLYAVDHRRLLTFNISNVKNPEKVGESNMGRGIETIFPYEDKLFIGSQDGLIIYKIEDPDNPTFITNFSHAQACDPVVVSEDVAYVTLRDGNECGETINQLLKINVANISSPQLMEEVDMNQPYGLGVVDDYLFICDGDEGVKVFNKNTVDEESDKMNTIKIEGKDVILLNNSHAIILTETDFIQYDISDINNIRELSTIQMR